MKYNYQIKAVSTFTTNHIEVTVTGPGGHTVSQYFIVADGEGFSIIRHLTRIETVYPTALAAINSIIEEWEA